MLRCSCSRLAIHRKKDTEVVIVRVRGNSIKRRSRVDDAVAITVAIAVAVPVAVPLTLATVEIIYEGDESDSAGTILDEKLPSIIQHR